jgi:N-ethylmaleimide reductase
MSPVSASSVRPDPDFRGYSFNCPVPKAPHPEPRELTTTEVETEIDAYVAATRRALAAGFDGVEIHAGSGYLPMQFLTSNTNLRTDRYGGSTAARSVFLLELVEALSSVDGAARVGIKLSPGFRFNDVHDADPVATYGHLFQQLRGSGIAYLQISDYGEYYGYEQQTPWLAIARDLYQGVLVANGGLGRDSGIDLIESGVVDAVAYGAFFISNPDLPERFLLNAPLNEPDVSTFYTQGTAGYTDYPRLDGDLPAHLAVTYTGIQTVQEAR